MSWAEGDSCSGVECNIFAEVGVVVRQAIELAIERFKVGAETPEMVYDRVHRSRMVIATLDYAKES